MKKNENIRPVLHALFNVLEILGRDLTELDISVRSISASISDLIGIVLSAPKLHRLNYGNVRLRNEPIKSFAVHLFVRVQRVVRERKAEFRLDLLLDDVPQEFQNGDENILKTGLIEN